MAHNGTYHNHDCACAACQGSQKETNSEEQTHHIHNHNDTVALAFVSGSSVIDPLLDNFSWTGTTGSSSGNLSYGFTGTGSAALNNAERAAVRSALQAWENVANVSFSSTISNPDISFTKTNFSNPFQQGVAFISFIGTRITDVDIETDIDLGSLSVGSLGYLVLLHEIGHALGLKHTGNFGGGDEAPFLTSAEDNYRASVMSYNPDTLVNDGNPPVTPMLYDIAAIQYLYGANSNHQSGNTLYDLTQNSNPQTIWDGGGNDTLSASSYSGSDGVVLDLRSGLENYSKVGSHYAWVAFNANIENAEGSSADDALFGTTQANMLVGRAGRDFLSGDSGADTIFGGVGIVDTTDIADTIYGGLDSDELYGNAGNDVIYGGRDVFDPTDSSDLAYGGKGFDTVYGNAGNDTLFGGGNGFDPLDESDLIYGGAGADELYGNGSSDTIFGGGSGFDPNDNGDLIFGGAGADSIFGNGGNDSIYGNEDNDTMNGGAGDDLFFFASGQGDDIVQVLDGAGVAGGDRIMIAANINNSGLTTSDAVLAATSYSAGNAFIDLGAGHTITIGGLGATTLIADDIGIF